MPSWIFIVQGHWNKSVLDHWNNSLLFQWAYTDCCFIELTLTVVSVSLHWLLFQWAYTDCCFSEFTLTVVSVILYWLLFQWAYTDCCFSDLALTCFSDLALWKSNLAFNNNQSLITMADLGSINYSLHPQNGSLGRKLTETTVSTRSLKQQSV
jgi:hypothetical protein